VSFYDENWRRLANKCQNCHVSVCSNFFQLCFYQILFELVYSWESYQKNEKGKLFIETQCIVLTYIGCIIRRILYNSWNEFPCICRQHGCRDCFRVYNTNSKFAFISQLFTRPKVSSRIQTCWDH